MFDSNNRKVKISANSNEAMSDNDDYLAELICVLEVEEMSKNFEGAMNKNNNQSLNEIKNNRNEDSAIRNAETSSKPSPNKLHKAETSSADRLHETASENVSVEAGCGRLNSNEKFIQGRNDQAFDLPNVSKVEASGKDYDGTTNINRSQCLSEIEKKQNSDNGYRKTKTRSTGRQNKPNRHHSRASASSSERFRNAPLETVSVEKGSRNFYSKNEFVLDRSQYLTKIKNKQSAVNVKQNTETYSRPRQDRRYNRAEAPSTDRSFNAPLERAPAGAGRGVLYSKYVSEYALKLQRGEPYGEPMVKVTNETMKKPIADNRDRNVETFSRRKPIKNYRGTKPPPASDSSHANPLENVSMGTGRGRLYSNSVANQQVHEIDPRLIKMIGERTEKSRLETEKRNSFQQMLEDMDKKLDKKGFIENWIYDCNKHQFEHKSLSCSKENSSFINSELPKTKRSNSGFQNLERVANSESRETERLKNSISRETGLAANHKFTERECASTTAFQKKDSNASSEFRGKDSASTPEFRKTSLSHNPESHSTNLDANSESFFQPESQKTVYPTDCTVPCETAIIDENASNIEKESLLVVEPNQNLTDSAVIENVDISRENVSTRTEHSQKQHLNPVIVNPNLEWRPLNPLASEFNISREFFPPLPAANSNTVNELNGAFTSNNCFLPTAASFIAAPIMPCISRFPILDRLQHVERVLVVENLPKTLLKKEVMELFMPFGYIKEINIENTENCCRAYLRADQMVLDWITSLHGSPVNGCEGSEALRLNIYYHV